MFFTLLNALKALGKTYDLLEINIKFMRSLPKIWDPKTTAMRELGNMDSIPLVNVFGKLLTYELDLKQREKMDKNYSNEKSISFKVEESESDSSSKESDEDIPLLAKKFKKFMRRRNFRKNQEKCSKKITEVRGSLPTPLGLMPMNLI